MCLSLFSSKQIKTHNKTIIIGGGFCDIRNNQGQPWLITLTAVSRPWLFQISQKPHPIIVYKYVLPLCRMNWRSRGPLKASHINYKIYWWYYDAWTTWTPLTQSLICFCFYETNDWFSQNIVPLIGLSHPVNECAIHYYFRYQLPKFRQGHPTTIFGKCLFGRRFEI